MHEYKGIAEDLTSSIASQVTLCSTLLSPRVSRADAMAVVEAAPSTSSFRDDDKLTPQSFFFHCPPTMCMSSIGISLPYNYS
mmetsp:Transcript_6997/g.19004  ORF Transcript_6997/g.19004 Transcript_6997/m.19004 type:complete len:82 (+) Transcript_6997:171-416(+)